VQSFLTTRRQCYEKVVDRLLASLGTASAWRSAGWKRALRSTNGYQTDGVRDMWRWRDWVIDASTATCRLTSSHRTTAGDMLPGATLNQRIATAVSTPKSSHQCRGGIVPEEFRVE